MRLKASHIALLANVGVPASSFIVTRRLYKITRLQAAMISRQQESGFTTSLLLLNLICLYQQKLIELLLELAICVGIPVGVAILCVYIF